MGGRIELPGLGPDHGAQGLHGRLLLAKIRAMRAVCCIVFFCGLACADPAVIQNRHIQIAVDPSRFSVTFLGKPSGENFLEVLPPADPGAEPALDGGGVETHLVPFDETDKVLRWGPADVVAHSEERVMMVGRRSAVSGLLLRKTLAIYPGRAKASFRVSVETENHAPTPLAVRNLARLAPGAALLVDKTGGALQQLTGLDDETTVITELGRYWAIGVPPESPQDDMLLGAFVREVRVRRGDAVWRRRILDMPQNEFDVPYGCTFLGVIDSPTSTYAAALQGATRSLRTGRSLVFLEIWELDDFDHEPIAVPEDDADPTGASAP